MEHRERTYLTRLRRRLHSRPEPSFGERKTAALIRRELEKCAPDRITGDIGGHGIVALYDSERPGPSVMLRCELDALPIPDRGTHDHRSRNEGYSHACGHDGHMAMVVGVARRLAVRRPPRGSVLLLFQPAEETGEGAGRMLADPKLDGVKVDRSYALHNLPGFESARVLLREGVFAAASVGLEFHFLGSTIHAAYPGQGKSPAPAVSHFMNAVPGAAERAAAPVPKSEKSRTIPAEGKEGRRMEPVATVTFVRLGERAFGITPGSASVGVTLRAPDDDTIERMRTDLVERARQLASGSGLGVQVNEHEPFAATVNAPDCVERAAAAARRCGLRTEYPEEPFPWSEDFGRFGTISGIGLIGIGAGVDHPHLHAPDYDFPDTILSAGCNLLMGILEEEWS